MNTLLVSTDFSSTGNNAVKFAAHYAAALRSNLIVFHAVHLPLYSPTISKAEFSQLEKSTEAKQHTRLDKLVSKIYRDQGLKLDRNKVGVVVRNSVFAIDAIVLAAKKVKADLIIVGTHGATGLRLLGSTTSELIFNAGIPVLAIPPRYRYKRIKTIVYASDFKNVTKELGCIMPMAERMKAVIEVLNIDSNKSQARPAVDTVGLLKGIRYKKIKIIVQEGKQGLTVLEQLQKYLKNRRPEILLLFPETRSLLDKLFIRSKTEAFVYKVKLPLLTYLKSSVK